MDNKGLVPKGENLRRAIVWLSDLGQKNINASTIEEACVRFDLTPKEEEFLLKNFIIQ